MQDRVANYPNRWKLTPVAGEDDTYDFTRADDPVVAGTPLNKATFLPDSTAAAIAALSGNTPSLPSEALDEIASLLSGVGMTGVAHIETGSYTGTGTAAGQNGQGGTPNTLTFTYKPRLVIIILEDGWPTSPTTDADCFTWQHPSTKARTNDVTVTDNVFEWHTTSSASTLSSRAKSQFNTSGQVYQYISIGVA